MPRQKHYAHYAKGWADGLMYKGMVQPTPGYGQQYHSPDNVDDQVDAVWRIVCMGCYEQQETTDTDGKSHSEECENQQ